MSDGSGDDERGEKLDMVFQVRCVFYVISDEGYQHELVSNGWVGAKGTQGSLFEMGSEVRELPSGYTGEVVTLHC
jgi:hypothetical protein